MSTDVVFVVGIPRSGTTWLWGLFGSLPDVAPFQARPVLSESNIFDAYTPGSAKRLIDEFATRTGGRVVEKTPDHLYRLPAIRSVYPEAPIVLIERDPRDLIASTMVFYRIGFAEALGRVTDRQRRIDRYRHLVTVTTSYETLWVDTGTEFGRILDEVGWVYPTETIRVAVDDNRGRSKIEGNYRRGSPGGHRTELTDQQNRQVAAVFDIDGDRY